MLLNEIEKWAKDTGAYGVRLVSGATRIDAHKFYKYCGYNERKEQKISKKYYNTFLLLIKLKILHKL